MEDRFLAGLDMLEAQLMKLKKLASKGSPAEEDEEDMEAEDMDQPDEEDDTDMLKSLGLHDEDEEAPAPPSKLPLK